MELTPKSQAEIAQSVEQCIRNAKVVGSIPIFGILRKSEIINEDKNADISAFLILEGLRKTTESEIILH